MVRIASAVLAYASAVLSYMLSIVLAACLLPSVFAVYVFAVSVGAFGVVLINQGSEFSLPRHLSTLDDRVARAGLIYRNIQRRVIAIPVFIALTAIVALYGGLTNGSPGTAIALALWFALQGLFLTAWYDYHAETFQLNLIMFLEKALSLLAVLVVVTYSSNVSLTVIAAVLLSARALAVLAQFWKLRTEFTSMSIGGANQSFKLNGASNQVAIGLLLSGIIAQGNQVILGAVGNNEGLAAYGIAFQTLSAVTILQNQVLRNSTRDIAHACQDPDMTLRSLMASIWQVVPPSVVIAAGIAVFLNFLPVILQDPVYRSVPGFALPLCTWVVIYGVGQTVTRHTLACGLDRAYVSVTSLAALTSVALGLTFIPAFGAVAAPIILLCSHSMSIGLNAIFLLHYNRSRIKTG